MMQVRLRQGRRLSWIPHCNVGIVPDRDRTIPRVSAVFEICLRELKPVHM
jgi:hypothetical protein